MQIIMVLLSLAGAVWLGSMAVAGGQQTLILLAASVMVALFAFFSPKLSLGLLVFSMLLSPEIGLGALSASRSLVIRYDDILLLIIFFSWFARTAIFKNKPFITSTPVQKPVMLYTALCVLSTGLGVIRGDLAWKSASLYTLKYVEYFLLYFMTVNIVESEADVKKYIRYGFIVALMVTVYAYYYYYASGVSARTSAPFEAPVGNTKESEPASLGGYYLLVFGILLALVSEAGWRLALPAMGTLIFAFPAFLFTFSRASYIGFAAMIPTLLFFTKKRRLLLIGLLAAGGIAFMLSGEVRDRVIARVTMTYTGVYARQSFDAGVAGEVKLEDSAASRVHSIKRTLFEKFPKHPVLGWGITGIGLGDTQYALVLGELGILGVILFAWMIYRLYFTARFVFSAYSDPLIRALSLGFMVSLVALLFQSLGVNTFIIVRIMEPFWFIAAMLSALYLKAEKEAAAESGAQPPGAGAERG